MFFHSVLICRPLFSGQIVSFLQQNRSILWTDLHKLSAFTTIQLINNAGTLIVYVHSSNVYDNMINGAHKAWIQHKPEKYILSIVTKSKFIHLVNIGPNKYILSTVTKSMFIHLVNKAK